MALGRSIILASILVSGFSLHASPASAIPQAAQTLPAPASVTISPGSLSSAVLIGAIRFSAFGYTNTTPNNLWIGVDNLSDTNAWRSKVGFVNGVSAPSSGVVSGDCTGSWDLSGTNNFVMEYQPVISDRLIVTLTNSGAAPINCSLVFNNFTTQVSTTRGVTLTRLIAQMNYLEVVIKRTAISYTSTLSNLTLNGSTLLGSFSPGNASPATSYITSPDLGSGFTLSGTVDLSGAIPNNCITSCEIEIRFGKTAALVVQNQIASLTPFTSWQFTGPTGTFTLPPAGGSISLIPPDTQTHSLTQTVKAGFTTTSTCSNGAAGNNAINITPIAGEMITCTFNNAFTPTYSIVTVKSSATQRWASQAELDGSMVITPLTFDIQQTPAPALGIGNAAFVLTQSNVGKVYCAPLLTGTRLSDLLVLSYSTYIETNGQTPALLIGWDDDSTDVNTGDRGRLVFTPNAPALNTWQIWNTLSDSAGVWRTSVAGPCDLTSSGCTWNTVLAGYPNAIIHNNESTPFGFIGVKADGGTGTSYFDALTVAVNQNVNVYDFEPGCTSLQCDAEPPDSSIVIAPATPTQASSATFTFMGDDGSGSGVASFQCMLDAGAWTSCASSAIYTSLDNGTHTFSMRAIDLVGNIDATPAIHTWVIDAVTPDSFITLKPSSMISSSSATLNFIAIDTGTSVIAIECRLEMGEWQSCTSPITLNNMNDGLHVLEARARDVAGNVETTPASAAWIVDTSEPQTSFILLPAQIDGANAAFEFSADDGSGTGIASYECMLDNGAWTACMSPAYLPNLGAGTHNFEARSIDAVGNIESFPKTHQWTVDRAIPNTMFIFSPPSATTSLNATLIFTASDDTTPLALLKFECSYDDEVWNECSSPFTNSDLAQGRHSFAVRAIDVGGNVDPSPVRATWLVDYSAPDTFIINPPAITSSTIALLKFIGSDSLVPSMNLSYECSFDDADWTSCTSSWALTELSPGNHTFAVRAIDTAGNIDSTPDTIEWQIDTNMPDTTILLSSSRTNEGSATFTFMGKDDLTSANELRYECRLDDGAWTKCKGTAIFSNLAEGMHTFEARAIDHAGNMDSSPARFVWTVKGITTTQGITAHLPIIMNNLPAER